MVQEELTCYRCKDSCYGGVVHLGGQYYHQYCFTCKKCNSDLVHTGYFELDGEFYCNEDYNQLSGTKCDGCGKYIEGEAVEAVKANFHPECFGCHRCGKVFPAGTDIVFDGEDFLCETCDSILSPRGSTPQHGDIDERPAPPSYDLHQQRPQKESLSGEENANSCAGCGNDIKSGQALLALEKQWHLWCFTCHKCGCLLAGEYMGRDGVPYCEQDYQAEFGVSCAGCGGYITGKVLQAGEKHYHPHCSRCAKCGDMFGEGEEMYLQGSEIWHPHCSEEFQRENEELERVTEAAIERSPHDNSQIRVNLRISPDHYNPPHVETYNIDVSETQSPQRSPNVLTDSVTKLNGYSHSKQSSFTSDGQDDRNKNIWRPPGNNEQSSYKPSGFRSVRPPEPVHNSTPPPQASDEDEPPPVPPPPSRSSSSSWKKKYSQPVNEDKRVTIRRRTKPLSFVESAAARVSNSNPSYQITTRTTKTTVSVSSNRTPSTSSSNDTYDERDMGPRTPVQKGVGFNKLKQRKMMKENSLARPNGHNDSAEKELDPDALMKLNADPNGNTIYYPYEVLKTNSYKMPPNVNRKILETYLTDSEFFDVFQMTRDKFYSLPKWRQEELKKRVTLF